MTIRSFSVRRDEKITCHVTVRGEKAEEILKKELKVKDYELRKGSVSKNGSFGFGISGHIDPSTAALTSTSTCRAQAESASNTS